jgi:hypothetical protein
MCRRSAAEQAEGGVKRSFICANCGKSGLKEAGHITRSRKQNAPLFCDRVCFGLSRRQPPKSDAEKRVLKAAYDVEYRERNLARIKTRKAAAYKAKPNRERERAYRQANMHRHVEYCRRPEYREWKAQYDRSFRAHKDFGPFADAALLLNDLEREISSRASRYEIYATNGTLNKALNRRRDYEKLVGC